MYSRLLPLAGAVPKPGHDITGAGWQRQMRWGESALFFFEEATGNLLTSKGKPADLPIRQYCMVFRRLGPALDMAKGTVALRPHMLCAIYDRHGRWQATRSRAGEDRRNPGVGLTLLLLQFPLTALLGTLAILAGSFPFAKYFGGEPFRWEYMSFQERVAIATLGLGLGALTRFVIVIAERQWIRWYSKPALQPVGSRGRQKFYEQLARKRGKQPSMLVPLEISFQPTQVEWQSQEKYNEWTRVLEQERFQRLGQYLMPQTQVSVEFWFNSEQELTATIANYPTVGMWLAVFTRYEDGSSFNVANKNATGVDHHPAKKIVYLGTEASAQDVIKRARDGRPDGTRCRPDASNLLENYKKSWREHIEWRRSRGTSAEEYRRVDERRHAATPGVSP